MKKIATIKPRRILTEKEEVRARELQQILLKLSKKYKDIPMVFLNQVEFHHKEIANDVNYALIANSLLTLQK